MKMRNAALASLIVALAIVCGCRSGAIGSSGKDIKKKATTEKASFIEADIKSHISLKKNGGKLFNQYYMPMRESRSFLEVKTSCDIYYDRDGDDYCLNTITFLTEKDGEYLKKWSYSDIEGSMVKLDEKRDYIYFLTRGCCGAPNIIKIYNREGAYLGEALGDIGIGDLETIWHVRENNNNHARNVLLGVNDDELFMIEKYSGIIYKSALPDDITLRFPTVEFADNETISLYTFNNDECEVEAFFKINKEKKVLTHKETKVVYCSETDSK